VPPAPRYLICRANPSCIVLILYCPIVSIVFHLVRASKSFTRFETRSHLDSCPRTNRMIPHGKPDRNLVIVGARFQCESPLGTTTSRRFSIQSPSFTSVLRPLESIFYVYGVFITRGPARWSYFREIIPSPTKHSDPNTNRPL